MEICSKGHIFVVSITAKAINMKNTNVELAKSNFLLSVANGDSFEWAFESGALMLDNESEGVEYAKFCADWKTGRVKGEVERYDIDTESFYTQVV